jgi:hypothetical protein
MRRQLNSRRLSLPGTDFTSIKVHLNTDMEVGPDGVRGASGRGSHARASPTSMCPCAASQEPWGKEGEACSAQQRPHGLKTHGGYLRLQDYRRRYNLEPLVKTDADIEQKRQRATVRRFPP